MTNSSALRELIESKGMKYKHVAQKLGLSGYGLALKIDNKNEFRVTEVKQLCEILGITSLRERERIFFADDVDNKSTSENEGGLND